MSHWTLFSNHGHVLIFLSMDSDARLRDIASNVGITERAVQTIIRDLQRAGFITVTRHGRRNRYRIHLRKSLRHDLESHCTVGQLVRLIDRDAGDAGPERGARSTAAAEPPGDAETAGTRDDRGSSGKQAPPAEAADKRDADDEGQGEQGSLF